MKAYPSLCLEAYPAKQTDRKGMDTPPPVITQVTTSSDVRIPYDRLKRGNSRSSTGGYESDGGTRRWASPELSRRFSLTPKRTRT